MPLIPSSAMTSIHCLFCHLRTFFGTYLWNPCLTDFHQMIFEVCFLLWALLNQQTSRRHLLYYLNAVISLGLSQLIDIISSSRWDLEDSATFSLATQFQLVSLVTGYGSRFSTQSLGSCSKPHCLAPWSLCSGLKTVQSLIRYNLMDQSWFNCICYGC